MLETLRMGIGIIEKILALPTIAKHVRAGYHKLVGHVKLTIRAEVDGSKIANFLVEIIDERGRIDRRKLCTGYMEIWKPKGRYTIRCCDKILLEDGNWCKFVGHTVDPTIATLGMIC
jgi:hypothetical protein